MSYPFMILFQIPHDVIGQTTGRPVGDENTINIGDTDAEPEPEPLPGSGSEEPSDDDSGSETD